MQAPSQSPAEPAIISNPTKIAVTAKPLTTVVNITSTLSLNYYYNIAQVGRLSSFFKNNLGKNIIDKEAGGVYYSAVGLGGQAHATLNSQAAGEHIFLFPSTMPPKKIPSHYRERIYFKPFPLL